MSSASNFFFSGILRARASVLSSIETFFQYTVFPTKKCCMILVLFSFSILQLFTQLHTDFAVIYTGSYPYRLLFLYWIVILLFSTSFFQSKDVVLLLVFFSYDLVVIDTASYPLIASSFCIGMFFAF